MQPIVLGRVEETVILIGDLVNSKRLFAGGRTRVALARRDGRQGPLISRHLENGSMRLIKINGI